MEVSQTNLEFFERKLNSAKSTKKALSNIASVPSKALLEPYEVSRRITQKKKPHTIGEDLILPAAIDMVSTMFGESMGQQLKAIPMSNDTVSRRIPNILEDLHMQLMEKVKNSHFAIQVNETSDLNLSKKIDLIETFDNKISIRSSLKRSIFNKIAHDRSRNIFLPVHLSANEF